MSSIPLSEIRALRDAANVVLERVSSLASACRYWGDEIGALRQTIARLDPLLVPVPMLIQVNGFRATTAGAADGGEGRRVAVLSAFVPRDRIHVTANLYGGLAVEVERALRAGGREPAPASAVDLLVEGELLEQADKRLLRITKLVGPARAA
jgi:hypothetical protein